MFGLPESGLAETLREAEGQRRRVRAARDHHLPAARRARDRHALRAGCRTCVRGVDGDACANAMRARSFRRTAPGSTIRWLRCWRAAASRRRSPAPQDSSRHDSPTYRVPPTYVAGGVVAYANEAKSGMLDVDAALIEANGAVSEPVAEAMAEGALRRFGADTAVATTGIAGPGGGTKDKPVGTVCFSRDARRRPDADANPTSAGQPIRHPGALDDGRDASAATSPARRERPCASSGLTLVYSSSVTVNPASQSSCISSSMDTRH